jgi:hypothetical protein
MTDHTDAISHVAQIIEHLEPGGLVTRFIVVAEVIDANGDRGVWINANDGATRGDKYGLLVEALEEERAKHHLAVAAVAEDDGE